MKSNDAVIKEYIQKETGLKGNWEQFEYVDCPTCKSGEFTYIYDDDKTLFCMGCNKEFSYDDANLKVEVADSSDNSYLSKEFAETKKVADNYFKKEETLFKQNTIPGFSPGGSSRYYTYKSCTHNAQHVIAGRGWGVYAGKKDNVKDSAHKFDVVMNLTWASIKEKHDIPIPELKKWEDYHCSYKEIRIDWPDYGVTYLPRLFWEELIAYLQKNKKKMLVFCLGGHGRTGTAVACMMVVGLGYTDKQAINWVRRHYCSSAIESIAQENYIKAIYQAGLKREEKAMAMTQSGETVLNMPKETTEDQDISEGEYINLELAGSDQQMLDAEIQAEIAERTKY